MSRYRLVAAYTYNANSLCIFRGVAGSAIHVEDKMSLEQFEQLKETFYSNDGDNHQGYLTKDQFKLAISGLLGIHDQDHMLSLLFVKVMLLDE